MGRARGRWGRLLLSEAQLEEVLGAQDQGEQEVRGCLEAQGCQEVPECQEEDTATQDVSASICPATWEVLECPQCHQPGLDQELDLVDLVPHLFLPRVETEQEAPQVTASAGWLRGGRGWTYPRSSCTQTTTATLSIRTSLCSRWPESWTGPRTRTSDRPACQALVLVTMTSGCPQSQAGERPRLVALPAMCSSRSTSR